MFENLSDSFRDLLVSAGYESMRYRSDRVSPAHILLALAGPEGGLAAVALEQMNANAAAIAKELERELLSSAQRDITPMQVPQLPRRTLDQFKFGSSAKRLLGRANEIRSFYGKGQVESEHVLLAMLESADDFAIKVIEEIGVNVPFLARLVLVLIAERDCMSGASPKLRSTVVEGISEQISERMAALDELADLARQSQTKLSNLPTRTEVAQLIFLRYVPQYLFTQVAYQRYLLEDTLRLLIARAGNLDQEITASTISSAAQTLREDARETIEYLWSQEFRALSKMPDEADYDLIGSVIEDLWWTHSEDIAVHDVFDEALDDHRRKQMLNLQKRRLEISQRFTKLRARLEDTIQQCFLRKSMSA